MLFNGASLTNAIAYELNIPIVINLKYIKSLCGKISGRSRDLLPDVK